MNLRQVRNKIKSVGNVKKITRAMQLVSAVKMRKAQQESVNSMTYTSALTELIRQIVIGLDSSLSPLLQLHAAGKTDRELLILISTNKGLCGSFNTQLFRLCFRQVDFQKTDVIVIGKKALSILSRTKDVNVVADFSGSHPLENVSAIFAYALKAFLGGQYGRVNLVYNRFRSALVSEPGIEQILPVDRSIVQSEDKPEQRENAYLIEPSAEEIVDSLLRSFVEGKIRNAIISSEAGEHSARMLAMKSATDNAVELIGELELFRNQLRQAKITSELLDMVTAKTSVEAA